MSLKRNIINLFASQSISYIIPLFQFPYLTRILGIEGFGLYVFSYSIISFLSIITNYGFEIYLPKEMATGCKEKNRHNEYFTQSTIIRTFLLIPCMIALFFIYKLTNYYIGKEDLLLWIAVSAFFNTYSLTWLFQGKEIIYLYSRISITVKLLSMALIFIFVKQPHDIGKVLFITALTYPAILIIALYFARKKYRLFFCKTKISDTFLLFKASFEYFFSRLGVSMYSIMGEFIVGTFSGSLGQVALYGAARQLYSAGIYAMSSISTPLVPYMARTKNYRVFFKITALSACISISGACIGWMFGEDILLLIYGESLAEAKQVLNIFMFTIILSVVGIHFGYPALIPLGKARTANLSVIYAGVIQLITLFLIIISSTNITAVTIALTYLLCDSAMTGYRLIIFSICYCRRDTNHEKNF